MFHYGSISTVSLSLSVCREKHTYLSIIWLSDLRIYEIYMLPGHVIRLHPIRHYHAPLSSICPNPATSLGSPPWHSREQWPLSSECFVAFIFWVYQIHRRCNGHFLQLLDLTQSPWQPCLYSESCLPTGLADLRNRKQDAVIFESNVCMGIPVLKKRIVYMKFTRPSIFDLATLLPW